MDKRDFVSLLQRQAEGKTSKREDLQIEQIWTKIYHHQAPFDWKGLEETAIKERIRLKIDQRLISRNHRSQLFAISPFFRAAAVIVFLLLGGLGYFLTSQQHPSPMALIKKHTNDSQKAKITLPDGTLVRLNVNSSISFPEKFEADKRVVNLQGEAFFEVKRDTVRPFYVLSNELETRVLGTSFNVNAYASSKEMITVSSGKVQVSLRDDLDKKVLLLPNEAAVFPEQGRQLNKVPFDAERALGWTSGKLDFKMVPFGQVINTLSEYYHKDIIIENYIKGSCLIKASYENNGLHFILSGLQLLVDFEYHEKENGDLVINYHSCEKPLRPLPM
ncbi:hypothetical protein GCM10028791_05480 [Echinicola sediminis]